MLQRVPSVVYFDLQFTMQAFKVPRDTQYFISFGIWTKQVIFLSLSVYMQLLSIWKINGAFKKLTSCSMTLDHLGRLVLLLRIGFHSLFDTPLPSCILLTSITLHPSTTTSIGNKNASPKLTNLGVRTVRCSIRSDLLQNNDDFSILGRVRVRTHAFCVLVRVQNANANAIARILKILNANANANALLPWTQRSFAFNMRSKKGKKTS
jgi:hypothetical protein